jgi:hypothetical protein
MSFFVAFSSNTLFAGSIYAGAIMAGYRLAEKAFEGIEGTLDAKEARIRYFKAILSDGFAVAAADNDPVRKTNGNCTLDVMITVNDLQGIPCALLSAEFVLFAPR